MQEFKKIDPEDLSDNVFKLLDKDWMLVTAGTLEHYNTMTASWGHMGIMWNLPVTIAWIRPQRHTFEFIEKFDYFTLSFFTEKYRKALRFCGSHSGRDYDKAAETGLSPVGTVKGNVFFEEARLMMECRKLYSGQLLGDRFNVPEIARKNYPGKDFHHFYMGQIIKVISRDNP